MKILSGLIVFVASSIFTPVFSITDSNINNTGNQSVVFVSEDSYIFEENSLVSQMTSKKPQTKQIKQTSEQLKNLKNTANYSSLENLYLEKKVSIDELIKILYEETKRLNTDNVKEILNVIKNTNNINHYYDDLVMLLHTVIEGNIAYLAKIIYFDYGITPSIEYLNKIFQWTVDEKLDLFLIKKLLNDGATFNEKNIKYALGFAMLENRHDDFNTILGLIIKNPPNYNTNKQDEDTEKQTMYSILSSKYSQLFEDLYYTIEEYNDIEAIEFFNSYAKKYCEITPQQDIFSWLSSVYGQIFHDLIASVIKDNDIEALKFLLYNEIYNTELLQFATSFEHQDIQIKNLLKNCRA